LRTYWSNHLAHYSLHPLQKNQKNGPANHAVARDAHPHFTPFWHLVSSQEDIEFKVFDNVFDAGSYECDGFVFFGVLQKVLLFGGDFTAWSFDFDEECMSGWRAAGDVWQSWVDGSGAWLMCLVRDVVKDFQKVEDIFG